MTKIQIEKLEEYYRVIEDPNKDEKEKLAKDLQVEMKNIKRFFMDRRHNDKLGSFLKQLNVFRLDKLR